jgi:hypothetical protein
MAASSSLRDWLNARKVFVSTAFNVHRHESLNCAIYKVLPNLKRFSQKSPTQNLYYRMCQRSSRVPIDGIRLPRYDFG